MNTYVTETADFYEAISRKHPNIIINNVEHITSESSIVDTNLGSFMCESFRAIPNHIHDVYMKVYEYI